MFALRLICAALAGAVVYLVHDWLLAAAVADLRTAAGTIAGASGTLLGFLISAGALLYAVANTGLVRNLQRSGHFHSLLRELFIDGAVFLVSLLVGLLCLILPEGDGTTFGMSHFRAGFHVLAFASTVAYLLLIPVAMYLWSLLTGLAPEEPGRLE